MIYYFSGTGNSRSVAIHLSELINESLKFIPLIKVTEEVVEGDSVGFVFPIYSWGVPPIVLDFIKNLPESFYNEINVKQIPVWCVMVCGDEVAMAPEMFKEALSEKGIIPESIWSVIMPNNYVLLPGFNIDSSELEKKKLLNMESRIKEVANGIRTHRNVEDVVRGSLPGLKTKLVYPLFKKYGIYPKKWYATSECIGCGSCASNCPMMNINMIDKKPIWGNNCCSCLACYHCCPQHAVQYGKQTQKKGQYWLGGGFLHKKRKS